MSSDQYWMSKQNAVSYARMLGGGEGRQQADRHTGGMDPGGQPHRGPRHPQHRALAIRS